LIKRKSKSKQFYNGGSEADQSLMNSNKNQSDLTFSNSRKFPEGSTFSATDDQRSKNPSAMNSNKTGKKEKPITLQIIPEN